MGFPASTVEVVVSPHARPHTAFAALSHSLSAHGSPGQAKAHQALARCSFTFVLVHGIHHDPDPDPSPPLIQGGTPRRTRSHILFPVNTYSTIHYGKTLPPPPSRPGYCFANRNDRTDNNTHVCVCTRGPLPWTPLYGGRRVPKATHVHYQNSHTCVCGCVDVWMCRRVLSFRVFTLKPSRLLSAGPHYGVFDLFSTVSPNASQPASDVVHRMVGPDCRGWLASHHARLTGLRRGERAPNRGNPELTRVFEQGTGVCEKTLRYVRFSAPHSPPPFHAWLHAFLSLLVDKAVSPKKKQGGRCCGLRRRACI